jgi:hypothetical protein
MGAVWLRANAPMGPVCRTQAQKLSVVMSFVVAIAMLQSTFLILTGCTNSIRSYLLHALQGYHGRRTLVKRALLRL